MGHVIQGYYGHVERGPKAKEILGMVLEVADWEM
jgi:hypothetical protein